MEVLSPASTRGQQEVIPDADVHAGHRLSNRWLPLHKHSAGCLVIRQLWGRRGQPGRRAVRVLYPRVPGVAEPVIPGIAIWRCRRGGGEGGKGRVDGVEGGVAGHTQRRRGGAPTQTARDTPTLTKGLRGDERCRNISGPGPLVTHLVLKAVVPTRRWIKGRWRRLRVMRHESEPFGSQRSQSFKAQFSGHIANRAIQIHAFQSIFNAGEGSG